MDDLSGHIFIIKETLNKSSAAAGGSFASTMQIEKLEIHKVFLRFSIFSLCQNPSPSALDDLIRASLTQLGDTLSTIATRESIGSK